MYCPKCGTQNDDNNFKCTRCGGILHPAAPRAAPAVVVLESDTTMGGLMPYKNGPALAAYYFGVFSAIPLVGIALGIVGVILGIIGLRRAKEHPEVKGKAHAWVGIIAGGLFALLYLGLIVVIVVSASS
jgi:hypothetical protein